MDYGLLDLVLATCVFTFGYLVGGLREKEKRIAELARFQEELKGIYNNDVSL